MGELPTWRDHGLELRAWEPSDAAALRDAMQDPSIVRWLAVEVPYTLQDAQAFIARTSDDWDRRVAAHFVVAEDAVLVGYLGVLAIEPAMRAVELVYWVAARARGRGLATRAVRAGLEWIHRELAVDRVELGMIAGNVGSARVAERNGFILREIVSGGARLDGAPVDEHIYELSQQNRR